MVMRVKERPHIKEEVDNILTPTMKKWFYSRFKEYSLPQRFGVIPIHSRKNILVSAPTGATKTLTGFMAILNELVDSAEKGILEDRVYCIYVSPLKALNNDIQNNLLGPLKEIEVISGKELGIRVAVRTGDTTQYQKSKMLKNPPHILITTPESLGILLSSIKFREHFRNVDWMIIDEIHALAENKRGVHLSVSLERLSYMSPSMTRVGLSATVAPLEEVAKYLVGYRKAGDVWIENDCEIIDVQYIKELDLQVLSPVDDLINTPYSELHRAQYKLMHKLIQEHKTTVIFTNTRAATERIVHFLKEKFPKEYVENIGAHHGSLSKEHRLGIEQSLREGKLKVVVCSTSLELGIDIGYIDLVICLGSPKSVARALQRIGRSGHQLHSVTKGRIIVLDRDDLVECSVLLKNAVEKKIDTLHIPTGALDVLIQHVFGMALEQVWEEEELFDTIKQSYCFHELTWSDFNEILDFLSGKFISLEDRHVYARIWRKEGKIGRRGKMSRVIYMTNIGTIPDQTAILVKVGEQVVGTLDEGFLERLRKGDIFVLGGNTYRFRYARGMVVTADSAHGRSPTVPSWYSEMLPLSFDLAISIGKFRRLMLEKFVNKKSKEEIVSFINEYLYVDEKAALAIYNYFKDQFDYVKMFPTDKLILVEHYNDREGEHKIVFHTLFGRRVNAVLARAVAFAITRTQHKDVEMGLSDNGFYFNFKSKVNPVKAFKLLRFHKLRLVMDNALKNSEVLRRRFRHCAGRAMMILRNYLGHRKRVGRQQVSSMILMNAVKRISPNFCVLREARREVLEDLMDIENAEKILSEVNGKKVLIKEIYTSVPSPFAFNLVLQGVVDILKMEDRSEFLRNMHQMVKAKIALGKR